MNLFTNATNVTEAISILEELAEADNYAEDGRSRTRCAFCWRGQAPGHAVTEHDDDCIWLRANKLLSRA